ncbi:MAG: minor capsid protein, partial [Cetobacterium sp.]
KDSATDELYSKFIQKRNKVNKRINKQKLKKAEKLVDNIDKTSFYAFKKELKDKFNLPVNQNVNQHKDIKKALIKENVDLINSLSGDYEKRLINIIYRGIARGEKLEDVERKIRNEFKVANHRARTIARDQTNKITSSLMIHNYKSNGISEAIWVHGGNPAVPRKSHVQKNGKAFDLDKGMYIDGEYIMPGQKINCGCTAIPIMPMERVTNEK